MQIFTEEVFQKDNFLAFYRHSQRLREIRRNSRDRLKTKSSTLENYKLFIKVILTDLSKILTLFN